MESSLRGKTVVTLEISFCPNQITYTTFYQDCALTLFVVANTNRYRAMIGLFVKHNTLQLITTRTTRGKGMACNGVRGFHRRNKVAMQQVTLRP